MKPLLAAAATEAPDDQLVAAVREGSEEAFEALYRRYRPRIVAYVRGMCSDHARAEDVAQDAFMSALRGLRSSDKEIAFRPWLYEIAKNACIDHMRRAGRSTEVSIDSDDFSPQEEGRISQGVSGTDAEAQRRKELETLKMAFGDLPPSQHEILVMRELEGLSYDRIGSRLGLTRGAVESLLFRARRTLRDGFDEIDTGARCVRIRVAMEAAADGRRTGARERRRIATHLRGCAACRRTAVAVGLDDLALAAARERGRSLRRVAGLLPLPAFLRRRLDDGLVGLGAAGPAAEQGASLAGKAAAVIAAAAVAAGGAGVANKATGGAVPLPGGLGAAPKERPAGGTDGGAAGGRPGVEGARPGGVTGAGAPGGAGSPTGTEPGHGGSQAGPSDRGGPAGTPGRAGDQARQGVGALTGPAAGAIGPGGTLVTGPSVTLDRVAGGVSGTLDRTVDSVTGGNAPQLPAGEVRVPGTGITIGGGDGGGGSRAPAPSGPLGGAQPKLPVDPPRLTVPVPDLPLPEPVTLPGSGTALP